MSRCGPSEALLRLVLDFGQNLVFLCDRRRGVQEIYVFRRGSFLPVVVLFHWLVQAKPHPWPSLHTLGVCGRMIR